MGYGAENPKQELTVCRDGRILLVHRSAHEKKVRCLYQDKSVYSGLAKSSRKCSPKGLVYHGAYALWQT